MGRVETRLIRNSAREGLAKLGTRRARDGHDLPLIRETHKALTDTHEVPERAALNHGLQRLVNVTGLVLSERQECNQAFITGPAHGFAWFIPILPPAAAPVVRTAVHVAVLRPAREHRGPHAFRERNRRRERRLTRFLRPHPQATAVGERLHKPVRVRFRVGLNAVMVGVAIELPPIQHERLVEVHARRDEAVGFDPVRDEEPERVIGVEVEGERGRRVLVMRHLRRRRRRSCQRAGRVRSIGGPVARWVRPGRRAGRS